MKAPFNNYRRLNFSFLTAIISTIATFFILTISYTIMGVEIRQSEIIVSFIAPLLIASVVAWYLFGLIQKLKFLEEELKQSITKEKEEVYLATIHGAQHITNNLLNGLNLVTRLSVLN